MKRGDVVLVDWPYSDLMRQINDSLKNVLQLP